MSEKSVTGIMLRQEEAMSHMADALRYSMQMLNWSYFHTYLLTRDKDYAFTHAVMGEAYMRRNYTLEELTERVGKLP